MALALLICGQPSLFPAAPTAASATAAQPQQVLAAEVFDAAFLKGDGAWYGLGSASDGRIYYQISSHLIDGYAQFYAFDPVGRRIEHLADMGDVVGEKDRPRIPQGKIHSPIFEHQGKLYLGTHVGYYKTVMATEEIAEAKGYEPYPGGHFLSFDLKTRAWERLAQAPKEESLLTMTMDAARHRLYGLTWPGGLFLIYDMQNRTLRNMGPVYGKAERGKGEDRMYLCRTLGIDARDGSVYWSNTKGEIGAYRFGSDKIETLPCKLGYNSRPDYWIGLAWHAKEQVFYGTLNDSTCLFRFDPQAAKVENIERIDVDRTDNSVFADPIGRPGPRGTLGFTLVGDTVHYLANGPGFTKPDGAKIRRTAHFISYDIPQRAYRDHGALRLADGRWVTFVHSIALAGDYVYSVGWVEVPEGSERAKALRAVRTEQKTELEHKPGSEELNLVRFRNPLR